MSNLAKAFEPFVRDVFGTTKFIPLHAPRFVSAEIEYLRDTIDSTFVSTVGKYVEQFEEAIKEYTGASYAIATVNGTAALHVALLLVGVQRDEEVITQSLTFVATCNAISYVGAHPVFVDVDKTTLGMSPDCLRNFLEENGEKRDDGTCVNRKTNRTIRACLPVHDLGHPARVRELNSICKEFGVILIEDAAESLGSLYEKSHTGLTGTIGTLSFNGNKIITTGGGGMLLTNDEQIAIRAKHMTTTAKQPHPWLFIHDEIAYNYRMPNLNAALGCAQIENIDCFIENKRELADIYREWFRDKGVDVVEEPDNARSNYWLNAIILNDRSQRNEFLKVTNERGVMTRPLWTPMHTLNIYKNCFTTGIDVTEELEAKIVCIPSSVRV